MALHKQWHHWCGLAIGLGLMIPNAEASRQKLPLEKEHTETFRIGNILNNGLPSRTASQRSGKRKRSKRTPKRSPRSGGNVDVRFQI